MKKGFSELFLRRAKECGRIVEAKLPPVAGLQSTVLSAMSYAVLAGGKRLRPLLMLESYLLFRRDAGREAFMRPVLEACMAAMEMIHSFSLCHDDLPCMDNDRYRRGRESVWYHYGEAMGTLAGDALSLYAFELVSGEFLKQLSVFSTGQGQDPDWAAGSDGEARECKNVCFEYAQDVMRAVRLLSAGSGVYGMLGGQVVDVEKTGQPLQDADLSFIYRLKTGALLSASAGIGACLAGAEEEARRSLSEMGEKLGVAFQIRDDILDEISSTEVLGKPVHSDAENGKTTYLSLHGLDEAERQVERLSEEAAALLRALPPEQVEEEHREFLLQFIAELVGRTY